MGEPVQHSSDGWIRDPDALFTLVQLGGVRVGDEVEFVRYDGLRWSGVVTERDETANGPTVALYHISTTYKALKGSPGGEPKVWWKLTGWRRPRE